MGGHLRPAWDGFNPRPSHERRHDEGARAGTIATVSIHAPRMRGDLGDLPVDR